ncbi:MAG TPA: ATP-binding cassette domain-containing protein, partial [Acidimicrobiia bacterium]|nr:ATP-binding cassette domain-containing protein [Acidimicrobiia bacterium]
HRIARAGLAHVPEQRGIFPSLTVLDNVRLSLLHVVRSSERGDAVDRAFAAFPQLADRRRQLAGTLSGGEQQMLGLARILAAPPRLLVADELSLGLAPLVVDLIFESLERARTEGVSVLLIEQYVDRALAFADQVTILRRGRVGWQGPSAEANDALLEEYLGGERGELAE